MNKNQEQEDYFDIGHIIGLLWKHVVGILFTGLIFGALLFGYARFMVTPEYEANALFYVNNGTFSLSDAVRITTGELNAANELVDTYVAILESRANMELVLEKSGANRTYEKLRKMIDAKAVNSTGLFQITVTSTNPEEARVICNTIADILPDKIADIVSNSSVNVVDYAVTPRTRSSPSYIRFAAIGVLVGMVLASFILIIRDLLDDIIHNEDYLLQTYPDLPILATIPNLTAKSSKKYGYYGGYGQSMKKGGVA